MGVVLNLCSGSSKQIIVPNNKLIIGNDMNCKYNNDINEVKLKNNNKNIVEEKKIDKLISGGLSNIEQICNAETYNLVPSSKGTSTLTTKIRKEKDSTRKSNKKVDKISTKDYESKKEEGNGEKSPKKKKEKTSKNKNCEQNLEVKENNTCSKKVDNIEMDEDFENMEISDTKLSEIVLSEKMKIISREKKKKIKGRNYINVVILGLNEVGKSSFCIRYVENKYEGYYIPSIGVENYIKLIAYNDRSYKINFFCDMGWSKNPATKEPIRSCRCFFNNL